MKRLWVHTFQTPLGLVRVASTEKGLALLALPSESADWFERMLKQKFSDHEVLEKGDFNLKVELQVSEYFRGKRRDFDLPLDLQVPPFHARVLKQVARIPFGETKTYGEIARAVRNPKAFRAVGSANARNLIPIVIPCHRVVASDGLGGYGGGLDMKKYLLRLESVTA